MEQVRFRNVQVETLKTIITIEYRPKLCGYNIKYAFGKLENVLYIRNKKELFLIFYKRKMNRINCFRYFILKPVLSYPMCNLYFGKYNW